MLFQDRKGIVTPQYKQSKTGCIKATARSTIVTANGFTLMKTKVSQCNGRLLLWFDGDPKRRRGENSKFQQPLCVKRGENVGAVSRKVGFS